jgi:hypothetical protein
MELESWWDFVLAVMIFQIQEQQFFYQLPGKGKGKSKVVPVLLLSITP